jgi:flagellar hook-length control protein FliK
MQASLQFFDMPLNGMGANGSQKIAIKMPDQKVEKAVGDENGFKAVMDALMALSPEQLQASLKQLEWVPVEEGVELFAPMIDLSGMGNDAETLFSMFAESEPLKQNSPLLLQEGMASEQVLSSLTAVGIPSDVQMPPVPTIELAPDIQGLLAPATRSGPQISTLPEQGASQPASAAMLSEMPAIKGGPEILLNTSVGFIPNQESRRAIELSDVNAKGEAPQALADPVVKKATSPESAGLKTEKGIADLLNTANLTDEPRKSGVQRNVPASHRNGDRLGRSDFQKDTTIVNDPIVSTAVSDKTSADAKPIWKLETEKFKGVPDPRSNGNDPSVTVAHPMKEVALKEMLRQQVQPSVSQAELDKADEKSIKIQPSGSAKDAALSFSSRWNALLDHAPETVGETKGMNTAPDKTVQSDVMRQIVQRMTLKNNRGQSQMHIKLKPEFLGNVRMQISTENQQVSIRMVAESSAVKEIIEHNIQYLKAELQQHGLQIHKFDVFVGSDNDGLRQGQQSAHFQQRPRQKGRPFKEGDTDNNTLKKSKEIGPHLRTPVSDSNSEIDYFA